MTIQQMRAVKQEYGLSNQEISRRSGVSVSTLQRIFSGSTQAPRRETLRALERVLMEWEMAHSGASSFSASLREKALPYAVDDEEASYTLEDYYALPEERRVELIDGKFYDMSAPLTRHQKILGLLYLQFYACAEAHGEQCEVYLSPCDVQLDRDNRTMLQPDLLVICGEDGRIQDRCIYGAPDLIVEILSPSTRAKDMVLKLNKYRRAGVREYWIVDPEKEEVLVYDFQAPEFQPEIYSFDSNIPIHISQGKCHIDFTKIHQKLMPRK